MFADDPWATIYCAAIARGCDHAEAAAWADERMAARAAEEKREAAEAQDA